ncbi:Kinetochore protein mis14 [Paramyrothecium foliicola]|nr:Kinetochore protein mis14 [Paramyrothecium foliicola]
MMLQRPTTTITVKRLPTPTLLSPALEEPCDCSKRKHISIVPRALAMDPESVVAQVQRRIELQAPEDLTYLVTNVRNAAAARINEAFPHVDGHEGKYELREQVEALVNEYINKTFSLAAPNLTINGLPVSADQFLASSSAPAAPEPAYEPFDTRKRRRVADLVTQEEKLLEEVAALKRSVPARAAAEQAERMTAGLKRDNDAVEERVARAGREAEASVASMALSPLERQAVVEEDFRRTVEGLGRLKRDMPAVVAKMERAKVAGEYAITERR